VAIGCVVLEVAERMTMRRAGGWVFVLEGRLQPVTMAAFAADRFRARRHHDMGVAVAVAAMGAMAVLDHLEQPVDVRFRLMLVSVLVLVVVPVRH
jgi:hypothetical protein